MNIEIKDVQLSEVEVKIFAELEDCLSDLKDLKVLKEKEKFVGKDGEVFVYNVGEDLKYNILVGLGKREELTTEKIRIAMSKAYNKVKEIKAKEVAVRFIDVENFCKGRTIKAIAEGLALTAYSFDKYKSDKKAETINVYVTDVKEEMKAKVNGKLNEAKAIINGITIARNLVNEPPNVIYPETLANEAKALGEKYGFEVQVLDKAQIEAEKMDAFLAVAKGSAKEPKFIIMRYFGDEANKEEIVGLVGKGLTFDTGGYSLKPAAGMDEMKSDMAGAAAVIGAMTTIASQKLKRNVVAVVAACENAISGGSYKPGDIINSMAGKTIEILNTDAEGRLTLADAVSYVISKEKATKVVDIATLTGAVLVALGNTTTAVITNNQEFYNALEEASKKSDERMWQLPNTDDYKKLIKSEIADLKNIGGKLAGTITAGLFIGEFAKDVPWMHLDIAGSSWREGNSDYNPKGGTGVGVKTLYYLVMGPCGCKH